MDDEPDRVKEVVWTGRSDRRVQNDAEIYEPKKIAGARTVYEVARDSEKVAGKQAKPLYTDKQPPRPAPRPAPAKPPVQADGHATRVRAAVAAPAGTAPRPAPAPAKPTPQPAPPAGRVARPESPGKSAPPSSRQQSHIIAKTVVGSFVERMKQEAQRKGGSLTLRDIESLDHEFEQKTAALEALFEKTFQDYARSMVGGQREERRHTPFDRLIVTPVEHLFPGHGAVAPAKGGLSRRILPGFFMAVGIMMGADVTEQCRDRAKIIFNRINGAAADPNWKAFGADPEARVLLTDALVAMAVHFANPDKRAVWVIDMINNHLSPPESEPDTPADWRLGRPAYERMIDSLFSEIMAAVNNAKTREGLTLRYGPETCASLITLMKGLGA